MLTMQTAPPRRRDSLASQWTRPRAVPPLTAKAITATFDGAEKGIDIVTANR